MDVSILQCMLEVACVCSKCKQGKLALQEDISRKMGLASFLVLECDVCSHRSEMYTSPKCRDSKAYIFNRSAVLGMLESGGGNAALRYFCACLNMPTPMKDETTAIN